jgi:adenylate kinase
VTARLRPRSAPRAERRSRPRRTTSAARRPVALTGTPGVGKSAVAARLASRWPGAEVAELALRAGAGTRVRGGVQVDLDRLRASLTSPPRSSEPGLLVGHLAHLLPVREAIVLRCHPRELEKRLRGARRGTARDRRANFVSEALDLVLSEALDRRLRVYEIDTTGRSVADVAREVDRRLRRGGAPRHGIVDWLSDPSVTEHLLDDPG